jgi:hypothetical protein
MGNKLWQLHLYRILSLVSTAETNDRKRELLGQIKINARTIYHTYSAIYDPERFCANAKVIPSLKASFVEYRNLPNVAASLDVLAAEFKHTAYIAPMLEADALKMSEPNWRRFIKKNLPQK